MGEAEAARSDSEEKVSRLGAKAAAIARRERVLESERAELQREEAAAAQFEEKVSQLGAKAAAIARRERVLESERAVLQRESGQQGQKRKKSKKYEPKARIDISQMYIPFVDAPSEGQERLRREALHIGNEIVIYSESHGRWFYATIVDCFTDKDGEWLVVEYGDGVHGKEIQRYSDRIRMLPLPVIYTHDI